MKYLEETDFDENNYSVADRFLWRGRLMERDVRVQQHGKGDSCVTLTSWVVSQSVSETVKRRLT